MVITGLEKFADLESKVFRMVELFKATRDQNEALEREVARFKAEIEQLSSENDRLKSEVSEFGRVNGLIKEKVETILSRLDQWQL
jgi:chromosome segregation ATPase